MDVTGLHCKVFLNARNTIDDLLGLLARVSPGIVDAHTVAGRYFEMDLRKNEDWIEGYPRSQPDYFIRFPYYLDVLPTLDTAEGEYIRSVSNLLERRWLIGIDAVAACDFEDALPMRGGYNPMP